MSEMKAGGTVDVLVPLGHGFEIKKGRRYCLIGGGIGNLIDRIAYGYVVDYLSLTFFSPVCNFADYCITIGVILLAVYLLFFSDKKGRKA